MPRTKRVCPAGEVFHVLNRAVARGNEPQTEAEVNADHSCIRKGQPFRDDQ